MKLQILALAIAPSLFVGGSGNASPYKAYTPPVVSGKVQTPYKAYTPPVVHGKVQVPQKPLPQKHVAKPAPINSVFVKQQAPGIASKGGLSSNKNPVQIKPASGHSLIGHDGGSLIGHDGGSLIGHDGGSLTH